jgi:hypothetical protein
MIEIENGIPIPKQTRKRKTLYPLADLGVGQSFFVACAPERSRKLTMSLGSSAKHQANKTGRRFTLRTVEGGIRVWRFE